MGITQVEIAQRVGLDVSSVNKILNKRKGPVFRKETIKKVLKVARDSGYDFGKLKHQHRRLHPRRSLAVPVALSIYLEDGKLFDSGTALLQELSLSGARLSGISLPRKSVPTASHTIGIRIPDGPLKDMEIHGRTVRLSSDDASLSLAVAFLKTEEAKARRLATIMRSKNELSSS